MKKIQRYHVYGVNPRVECSTNGVMVFWDDIQEYVAAYEKELSKIEHLEWENKKLKDLIGLEKNRKLIDIII